MTELASRGSEGCPPHPQAGLASPRIGGLVLQTTNTRPRLLIFKKTGLAYARLGGLLLHHLINGLASPRLGGLVPTINARTRLREARRTSDPSSTRRTRLNEARRTCILQSETGLASARLGGLSSPIYYWTRIHEARRTSTPQSTIGLYGNVFY